MSRSETTIAWKVEMHLLGSQYQAYYIILFAKHVSIYCYLLILNLHIPEIQSTFNYQFGPLAWSELHGKRMACGLTRPGRRMSFTRIDIFLVPKAKSPGRMPATELAPFWDLWEENWSRREQNSLPPHNVTHMTKNRLTCIELYTAYSSKMSSPQPNAFANNWHSLLYRYFHLILSYRCFHIPSSAIL